MSHQSENCRSVCACVMSTPFGAPVVPDVNSTSLDVVAADRARSARRPRRVVDRVAACAGTPSSEWSAAAPSSNPTTVPRCGELGAQPGQRRRVVGAEELAHRERDARAAALEDVAHLVGLEARVHRHDRAAGAEDAERGDQPLVAVRRPDRDPLAALDARRASSAALHAPRVGDQLGERDAADRRRPPPRRRRSAPPRRRPSRGSIAQSRSPRVGTRRGHVSSGASDARNSRVRAARRRSAPRAPLPNGRIRAEKSVAPGVGEASGAGARCRLRSPTAAMSPTSVGVALLEQALVVRRVLGVPEDARWRARVRRRPRRRAQRPTGTPATTRGAGRPAAVGGLRDPRHHVVGDGTLVGHPEDGAVGALPREPQHHRTERGEQHRRRRRSVTSSGLWIRNRSFSTSTGLGPANMASNTSR